MANDPDYDDEYDDDWDEDEDDDGDYENMKPPSVEEATVDNPEMLEFVRNSFNEDANSTWCAFFKHGEMIRVSQGLHEICFASLNEYITDRLVALSVGYTCNTDNKVKNAYWDWLVGETSPWRSLHKGDVHKIINHVDHMRGFYFGPEAIKSMQEEDKMNYLLNFLIATRHPAEYPEAIRFWKHCVDMGIDPNRAFLYCRHMNVEDNEVYITRYPVSTGHWSVNGDIDYSMFKESRVKLKKEYKGRQRSGKIFNQRSSDDYDYLADQKFDPLKDWFKEDFIEVLHNNKEYHMKEPTWSTGKLKVPLEELDEYMVKEKGWS